MNELMYLYSKKVVCIFLCTLVYAGVYLLSDASPYCDVILAPRMVIVLVRCGDWHDKARRWPLNKGIIEHMCIYGHALRGPPPPSPPKGQWSGYRWGPPSPVVWGVGSLFPPWGGCGVWGFGV